VGDRACPVITRTGEVALPTSTWHNLDLGRRARILHAAMVEFGHNGYSSGSLNVVAREAGVAKGSLFQYFDDKFDLYAYVAEQTSMRIREALRPWLTGPPDDQPFAEYLLEAVRAWIRYFAAHPVERGVTAATNLELDARVRLAVRGPVHEIYVDNLRPIVTRARDRGDLRPDADLDALLSLLLMLLPHLALAPFEPGLDPALPVCGLAGGELDTQVQRLLAAALAGFLAPAPAR
jgi:AcrR family transcriptional regulator